MKEKATATVRVEIWSGTWREKESSNSFLAPPDADYEYLHDPSTHRTFKGIGWGLDSERIEELKLLRPWKTGRIVGVGIFVLIAIGIGIFFFWRKKKHKQKIQS